MTLHKSGYTWDAEEYSLSSSQQKKWGRELIGKLVLEGGERLLDVGCGDGKLTAEIAARLPRGSAHGVDSSGEMIELARATYPPDRFPNLSWEVRDARELDYAGEFDVAFSNAALHWIIDHRPVLEGIRGSLRPGGRILIQMGGRGNASRIAIILAEMLGDPAWNRYFAGLNSPYGFYGPEDYDGWLREAGLLPQRVELVPKDMVHEGGEGLAAWIRTTWLPFTQRIPEERREVFIAELVGDYLRRHPPDEEGLVHVDAVRLEVEAVRPA